MNSRPNKYVPERVINQSPETPQGTIKKLIELQEPNLLSMDHPIPMSRNTLNIIPLCLPTQRIRKLFYILDLLHKIQKDKTQQTPANQDKCNIKSLKQCHTKTPKKYYNIGSA